MLIYFQHKIKEYFSLGVLHRFKGRKGGERINKKSKKKVTGVRKEGGRSVY